MLNKKIATIYTIKHNNSVNTQVIDTRGLSINGKKTSTQMHTNIYLYND